MRAFPHHLDPEEMGLSVEKCELNGAATAA